MKFPEFESQESLRVPRIGVFDPIEEARHLFNFMKIAECFESVWSRAIPLTLKEFNDYRLLPVSRVHLGDTNVVSDLMNWRNENFELFSPQKLATVESTSVWLESLVNHNPDRILFFVVDRFGNRVGHLGVWIRGNTFELDNVIKASSCEVKGLFSAAVLTLASWVNEFVGIDSLELRVLESNQKAVNFYKNLKFEVSRRQGLKLEKASDGAILVEVGTKESSNDAWLVMKVDLNSLQEPDDYVLTAGPSIGPFEISIVSESVRNGWNHHHSDYLSEFTKEFAKYVGSEFAIPTDSCTSALHLALWALGIGPGDEVIVPEVTWVATANAVKYVGATPVFADIDPFTWCIDPKSVESLISSRTKAVMPVHLYGYVSDLESLKDICEKHNLKLVQDAAPGIGSTFQSKGVATIGEYSCFSFQGAKLLVSGEGGVLTTNDPNLYAKAFKIGDSGRRPGTFWIETLGKKMKMSNMTAALALSQLQSAERQINKKRMIRDWYVEELAGLDGLSFQQEGPNTRSICWMTSIHISRSGFNREEFRDALLKLGVETRPVFSPISRYPIWGTELTAKENAAFIGDNAINLPSGVALSRATVAKVSEAVRKVLN